MRLIDQSHTIEFVTPMALEHIERAGRTCYRSEDRITPDSAPKFVRMLIGRHHESVLEHATMTVRFITDRGVTHELVRHRIASFSQESTRYVNYGGKDMVFIRPVWCHPDLSYCVPFKLNVGVPEADYAFVLDCEYAEKAYARKLAAGWTPQQARVGLPASLGAEIVVTANLREWRHILRERTSRAAHPQMRALMLGLLSELRGLPIAPVFEDLVPEP